MGKAEHWQNYLTQMNEYAQFKLGDLVEAWRGHIDRLLREQDSTLEDHSVWGAHDYAAALHLRDGVARGLNTLPDEGRFDAISLVRSVDEIFMQFTEPDIACLVVRFLATDECRREWWWYRIPTRGPVRDELQGG